jgi:hypothetical protein
LKQSPPRRCGGVDSLLFEEKVTAGSFKLVEKAHQVLKAAPKPVDRPGSDNIDLAPGNGFAEPIGSPMQ